MSHARAAARPRVIVNGRFVDRPPTGVDRVAMRILQELDRALSDDAFTEVILALPKSVARPVLRLRNIVPVPIGRQSGIAWEQVDLPAAFGGDILLNLCNTAPALHPRNIVVMHDTLTYDEPGSYGWAFRAWYKALLPIVARRAHAVITVSNYSAERLRICGVLGAERHVNVIANGGDHLLDVAAADMSGSRPFVLFVGSPAAHKNLQLFCAMAGAFVGRLEFVAVGAGDSAIYRSAKAPPPPENLHMLGRVSDGKLKGLYQCALCLAFPSRAEGFGFPPLEAMSLGCPVISAPSAAMPEILGDAALYADPRSLVAWTDAIEQLRQDARLRSRLIESGLARAARYTWRGAGEAYLRILRAAVLAAPPLSIGDASMSARA